MAGADIGQRRPGADQPRLDQGAERDARLATFPGDDGERGLRRWLDRGDARFGGGNVVRLTLDPDEMAAEAFGDSAGRPGAEERVEDDVPRL